MLGRLLIFAFCLFLFTLSTKFAQMSMFGLAAMLPKSGELTLARVVSVEINSGNFSRNMKRRQALVELRSEQRDGRRERAWLLLGEVDFLLTELDRRSFSAAEFSREVNLKFPVGEVVRVRMSRLLDSYAMLDKGKGFVVVVSKLWVTLVMALAAFFSRITVALLPYCLPIVSLKRSINRYPAFAWAICATSAFCIGVALFMSGVILP